MDLTVQGNQNTEGFLEPFFDEETSQIILEVQNNSAVDGKYELEIEITQTSETEVKTEPQLFTVLIDVKQPTQPQFNITEPFIPKVQVEEKSMTIIQEAETQDDNV